MFVLVGVVIGWVARSWTLEGTAYTLYRNSPVGTTERIHVATFDTTEAESYNHENCQIAQTLYQQQPGVTNRFWCEKGRYRR